MINVVPSCNQQEYTVGTPVYDVRDYGDMAPGIYTLGGFIAELMITLHSLQDYMISKGDAPTFEVNADIVMKFMEDLLVDGYPAGICTLKVNNDPLSEEE